MLPVRPGFASASPGVARVTQPPERNGLETSFSECGLFVVSLFMIRRACVKFTLSTVFKFSVELKSSGIMYGENMKTITQNSETIRV